MYDNFYDSRLARKGPSTVAYSLNDVLWMNTVDNQPEVGNLRTFSEILGLRVSN